MKSMVELSRKANGSKGRSSSTADKIIFSTYKDKDGDINQIVFYIGKNLMKHLGIDKGSKLDAGLEYEESQGYYVIFETSDNGKTISIQKSGRGVFTIKWCEGLPYPDEKIEMADLELCDDGTLVAWFPREGVQFT